MAKKTLEERFWEKVDMRGPDECWEWQACVAGPGYGRIGNRDGKTESAHRIAWELTFGAIPKGRQVLHICGNKLCVNPTHLKLMGTLEERFWDKVNIGKPEGCWEWEASTRCKSSNYGSFGVNGHNELAHRMAWTFTHGGIPDGMCVCHRCDNPACCNPVHLFLGTILDNNHDRDEKGRQVISKGEKHGMVKLTKEQVKEIRAIYAAGGISQLNLGKTFGVSERQIGRIVHKEGWKHV